MKCKHCNSTWNSVVHVKICPFCGESLCENIEYTIASALTKVVEDCGLEMLHNSGKITAYIMDYVKGDERNKKLFRIAGNAGVFDLLYEAKISEDKLQQESLMRKSLKLLEEDAFLSTENAMHIVRILAEGLSLEFKQKDGNKNEKAKELMLYGGTKDLTESILKAVNKTVKGEDSDTQIFQTREQYLMMLVNRNKRVTKEENQEIFVHGKKVLREGDIQLGIKLIRFASNHGLKDADLLLGYCYEQGIGVKKNANAAEAFYRAGTISNSQFEKFYQHGRLSEDGFRKAAEYGKRLYEYALIKRV